MSSEGAWEKAPEEAGVPVEAKKIPHFPLEATPTSHFHSLTSSFSLKSTLALAKSLKSPPHLARPDRRKKFTEEQRVLASQAKSAISLEDLHQQVRILL
jgi:hypothetical protein